MKELLEAGVHFGHQTHRWNPKMKDFIYGEHNNIHIIDLSQTMGMLKNALGAVREVTQSGGRILFVGTKRQASETISESASQCAQYYVNHRWLGGTLTNWKTISNTIARLKSIQETLDEEESAGLTKKELLKLTRERDKLELSIGGIKNMGSLPDLIFVIDTVREQIAIKEANKLNIPIAAIIDTNCDPEGITYLFLVMMILQNQLNYTVILCPRLYLMGFLFNLKKFKRKIRIKKRNLKRKLFLRKIINLKSYQMPLKLMTVKKLKI